MLTKFQKSIGIRYATQEDINHYELVAKLLDSVDEVFLTKCIDAIGDYVAAYIPSEIRRTYNRAYYYAKKLGTTVPLLANWYFIDEISD